MRLYLLPISTRRTLLYAQRFNVAASTQQTWSEKIQNRVAKTWADWEKKEKGWQKSVVSYGNYALRRIPYEEWGLKSVPPLSSRRQGDEMEGRDPVEVVYPKTLIQADKVKDVLHTLGTEREGLHRQRMIWCFVAMPFTAPIAVLPVIPNLPFFYLVYRAWSHWRALAGGRHVQFLLKNSLLTLRPSPILDEVYAKQAPPLLSSNDSTIQPPGSGKPKNTDPKVPEDAQPGGEVMLLTQDATKKMTELLDLPQLEVELERAIWQVELAIKKQNEEDKKGPKDQPEVVQEGEKTSDKKSQ